MTAFFGEIFQAARTRRWVFVGLAAAAVGLVGVSSGAEPPYPTWPLYHVTLEDESGNPLRTFPQRGNTFVLGAEGQAYDVRIDNDSNARVEAVLSVDGRDSITGDVGDYVEHRGYIVPAHGSVVVDGFRQSLERVARFRFSRPAASYSSRMGTPENVGVIGVAFFPEEPAQHRRWYSVPRAEERERPAPPSSEAGGSARAHGAAPAGPPSDAAREAPRSLHEYFDSGNRDGYDYEAPRDAPRKDRLGTEYGESTASSVVEIPFRRQTAAWPATLLTLRYDDAAGLKSRGIEVYPAPSPRPCGWFGCRAPEPFPNSRFAPPPP